MEISRFVFQNLPISGCCSIYVHLIFWQDSLGYVYIYYTALRLLYVKSWFYSFSLVHHTTRQAPQLHPLPSPSGCPSCCHSGDWEERSVTASALRGMNHASLQLCGMLWLWKPSVCFQCQKDTPWQTMMRVLIASVKHLIVIPVGVRHFVRHESAAREWYYPTSMELTPLLIKSRFAQVIRTWPIKWDVA